MATTKAKKEENITAEEALFGDVPMAETETEEEKEPTYSDAPIRLTDGKTHKVYNLDYSRETVILAERAGLVWDEIATKPAFTVICSPPWIKILLCSEKVHFS